MSNFVNQNLFIEYQNYIDKEQEIREEIRTIVKQIDQCAKEATIHLQGIHSDLRKIPVICKAARKSFTACSTHYQKLASIIPLGQYYRFCDHWFFITQRLVFLVALTVYLETDALANREEVADILGLKSSQKDGFHLDIEDYLVGVLQLASELSRFATNSVTLGDYERPLKIAQFVAELNSGFRLLNLKNDSLRKRFDALKYDVKKIEEIVYDISIRGLRSQNTDVLTKEN